MGWWEQLCSIGILLIVLFACWCLDARVWCWWILHLVFWFLDRDALAGSAIVNGFGYL